MRIVAPALVAAVLLALAGCADEAVTSPDAAPPATSQAQSPRTTQTAAPTTAPPVTPLQTYQGTGSDVVDLTTAIEFVGLEVFLLSRRDGQTLVTTGPRSMSVTAGGALLRMLIFFAPFVLMSIAGSNPDSAALNTLAVVGFLSLLVSIVLAAIPRSRRRSLHDLAARTRVVRSPKRRIDWRQDARMVVPGRVDMTKRLSRS